MAKTILYISFYPVKRGETILALAINPTQNLSKKLSAGLGMRKPRIAPLASHAC